jgi:aldehyde dehydrogenase (NAD+)
LIVPEHRFEEIQQRLRVAISALRVGDPKQAETKVGPMVSKQQYERVQRYIRLGIDEGAQLLVGGEGRPDGIEVGYFVKPTVFTQVTSAMTIAKEEIFGPVLSVLTYKTEDEAIAMANDTIYGLQAYVFSGDRLRAQNVASHIVAGRVFINGLYDEPEAPFGGFRQSGIGREFGSWGLEEYLEPKGIMGLSSFGL